MLAHIFACTCFTLCFSGGLSLPPHSKFYVLVPSCINALVCCGVVIMFAFPARLTQSKSISHLQEIGFVSSHPEFRFCFFDA